MAGWDAQQINELVDWSARSWAWDKQAKLLLAIKEKRFHKRFEKVNDGRCP